MDTIIALALAFSSATHTFHLPEGLLPALCFVESGHHIKAINPHDGGSPSLGVCQVKESTARFLGYKGSVEALQKDLKINTYYSAKYLRYQMDRYHNDIHRAVAAYNAGTYKTDDKGQIKNVGYVVKVFKAWGEKH